MSFRFSKSESLSYSHINSLDLLDLQALKLCEFLDKGGKKVSDSAIALSPRIQKTLK